MLRYDTSHITNPFPAIFYAYVETVVLVKQGYQFNWILVNEQRTKYVSKLRYNLLNRRPILRFLRPARTKKVPHRFIQPTPNDT